MAKKILFYGDIACDLVIRTEVIPEDGHDATITDLDLQFGGSSANSAVVAASLGVDAYYMGFIGNDIYSSLLLQDLKANHVKTDLLRQVSGKSTMIIAMINKVGEKSMLSYRGVNAKYSYEANFEELVSDFDMIHVSGYCLQNKTSRHTAIALINVAKENGIPVSIDPSFLSSNLDSPELVTLMSKLTFIFPNRSEAEQITNETSLEKQAEKIHEMGIDYAVLKLDEAGCFISHYGKTHQIDAYPQPNLVNAVGAGDAFCAGFIVAYCNDFSLIEAGKLGNACAHIILEGNGGHNHAPTQERLKKVLSSVKDQALYKRLYSIN